MSEDSLSYLAEVTAVILAGGKGTRLQSAVADRPKVLAEIHGRPFLTYLFDQLMSAGLRSVILCTGFMADDVYERIGEKYGILRVQYSKESKPLGTAGALRNALPLLNTGKILVMNGDSFVNIDLGGYMQWYHERDREVALLLIHAADARRYGRVEIGRDERIVHFEEKNENSKGGLVNAGIYLMRRDLIASIPPDTFYSLERDLLPGLIDVGIYGYQSSAGFIDIGTPESYRLAQDFFTGVNRR
jgi:D-glycero-alpha-D-manno-heptose 1-phosphate guanylyltransferase